MSALPSSLVWGATLRASVNNPVVPLAAYQDMTERQRVDVYHHRASGCGCGSLVGFIVACAVLGWPLAEIASG